MATERDRNLVEQAIGHQFHDQELLKKAMTAAGAEVDDHDGNRHLASVGQAVLRLVIADSGYTKVMLRGQMGEAQALLDSKSRLASAATQLGIVGCIKVCPISGPASKSVIALAMRAIIGAVWKDTSSLDSVGALVQRLSLLVYEYEGSSIIPSSPNIESVTGPVDTQGLPSPPLFGDLYGPISETPGAGELPRGEFVVDSVDCGAGYSTALYLPSLNNLSDTLSFDLCDATMWDTTVDTVDGLLTTESGTSLGTLPSSTLTESTCAGYKRTNLGNNPSSSSAAPTEEVFRNPKRQKLSSSSSNDEAFEDYIALENRRCANHGLQEPKNTYLTQAVLNDVSAISKDQSSLFMRLLVGICSPSTIVALRATLISIRGANNLFQPPASDLSVPDRFSVIEATENHITSLTMLRRCHILRFWEHYSADQTSCDGWISMTAYHETTPKRAGNPQNYEKSLVTKTALQCIFPGLTEPSFEYNSKYDKVKRLLSLGQKLSKLTRRFGQGILGLIQCCEHGAPKTSYPNLSDHRLCSISSADFDRFLLILDQSQGSLLREFSEAATPMVQHVLQGTVKNSQIFRIESIDPEDIWQLPKGSPTLLAMLG